MRCPNALVGLHEQVASRIETDFRDQFTVAGACLGEITLQRAGAYPELTRDALKRCITVTQRRLDRRSHRVSGWQTDRLHRHVVKGGNPLPPGLVVVPASYERSRQPRLAMSRHNVRLKGVPTCSDSDPACLLRCRRIRRYGQSKQKTC